MLLDERLRAAGRFLFSKRSYTPLVLLPLFIFEYEGVFYPAGSHAWDEVFEYVCLGVVLAGAALRVWTVAHVPEGTSGRKTKRHAPHALNVTGAYSVVRNPLYLGNYVIFAGLTLLMQNWELLLINTLVFAGAYGLIVLGEEQVLQETFGDEYREYAARVPCFIPRLRLWVAPATPWNWRMVLRREHDSVFASIVLFVAICHYRDRLVTGRWAFDLYLAVFAGAAFAAWLVIKSLKLYTRLLNVRRVGRAAAEGSRSAGGGR